MLWKNRWLFSPIGPSDREATMFLRQARSLPSVQKENHSIRRDPEIKGVYPKILIRSHPSESTSKGASEH